MTTSPAFYFVTDIETDGPDPAQHSMLSFATVVLRDDGALCGEFEGVLKPRPDRVADERTMKWWSGQPEAWSAATTNPQEPEIVMSRYADWVEAYSGIRAFAARPLMFDGVWIDTYLRAFAGCFVLDVGYWGRCIFNASPLDIGTYTSGVFGRTSPHDAGVNVPADWLGHQPHTHRAIDDARGYAFLLAKLFEVARSLPENPVDFTRVKK
ncbi:DNA polymerase III subunit epsilon [Rhizobium sp. CG5]|uniref:3'-5' exoribonuclease domain-containing protein n=1 Tax=Rhizobium sp. CG5 TaxID=2726076 RepID=UPI0020334149|nr:3'-5' exoribonuclease [Rhizobium sp. CG5]MCM2473728.1 DNA polymerase III subunit epsilon [Rhizobium sp. CG5]